MFLLSYKEQDKAVTRNLSIFLFLIPSNFYFLFSISSILSLLSPLFPLKFYAD